MQGKAQLINGVFNGQNEEALHRFKSEHFDTRYQHRNSPAEIISKHAKMVMNWFEVLKFTEDVAAVWDFVILDCEQQIKNYSADLLINHAQEAVGGIMYYELQKLLAEALSSFASGMLVTPHLAGELKKKEIGAKQQMVKGLRATHKIMRQQRMESFILDVGFDTWSCSQLLTCAKDLAGECVAARTLHGDSACNKFAAYASTSMLALVLFDLDEKRDAYRQFLSTLKLYKEAQGEKNPREDEPMKELFAAFEGVERVSEAAIGTESIGTETQEEEDTRACVVCCVHKAEFAYPQCGHLCLCVQCHETPPLPGAANVLEVCPLCRAPGARVRIF
jgi:hypothetical protein